MITPQAQIKLNLPLSVKKYLENKSKHYGLTMADYLRYLILKDMQEDEKTRKN